MTERVAIIGASGYKSAARGKSLDCFPWDRLGIIKNLSDYHSVIVNLLSPDELARVHWQAFRQVLNNQTMAEILGADGRIIVVGDPRFVQGSRPGVADGKVGEPFLRWSGISFVWDDRPGLTKTCKFAAYRDRTQYGGYLEHLVNWSYSLRSWEPIPSGPHDVVGIERLDPELEAEVVAEPFCRSRFGTVLAGAFRLAFFRRVPGSYRRERADPPVATLGPLILLPRTTLTEDESLKLILKDTCGIKVETPEPAWVAKLEAPGQREVDVAISRTLEERSIVNERLETQEFEREQVRSRLKLLYGQHNDLEVAVRQVLVDLEADVTHPSESDEEDGWVSVRLGEEAFEGVLEIKGTAKRPYDEYGLRQLWDWVGRGRERGKRYKGLFIGNAAATIPTDKRPNAFGANFVKKAKERDFALIKSEDLYLAYQLKALSLLDVERFWRDVFDTKGVFDAAPYRAKLPPNT